MNIKRKIAKSIGLSSKSILLLGPRQVGKSTLIETLKPDLSINLSDEMEFLRFSSQPSELRKIIEIENPKTVFIDEVQRLPKILNTVQALVDKNKKLKFYLTGSSARKLKRGGANLLPGRVLNFQMGPFVSAEFNYKMETQKALSVGCLPEAYLSKNPKLQKALLKSYAANYLKEEIKAEALTRNLESFARFLQESILNVGQFIDYTKLAKKAMISRHACPRYFEILEDTLVGSRVFCFEKLQGPLDLIKHPKFYLFDNGVFNGLLNNFEPSLDRVGPLAEQLVYNQLMHSGWAAGEDLKISTLRTRQGNEVDFIVEIKGKIFAIEVKYSDHISMDDLEGLNFFNQIFPKNAGLLLFHMGQNEKKWGKIWSLPWQKGLQVMGL